MGQTRPLSPDEIAEQTAATQAVREMSEAFFAEKKIKKGFYVLTFGCQQNEADSEKLAGMALAMGYEKMSEPEENGRVADLILVNTCAIREHAEEKALSLVGQFKHLKAKNPEMILGVCGCMVSQDHRVQQLKMRYPYVDFTLGTASLHRLPSILAEKLKNGKRIFCPTETEFTVAEGIPVLRESTWQAWVSVMYGCNNFCSYCIVPYVRGRERSRAPQDILREIRELVAEGYRDITLLGQNVNSYGKDRADGYDFADLLAEADAIEGDFRLRFMTSHPKDATHKLIDVMANGRHIAHQFHLPMQSGSDKVLKEMNRHYDYASYRSTLSYIREKMPDAAVSSDIIVGFPGESDGDFEDTMKALEDCRFDMIFSFLYSPRVGTPAAAREDQIPDDMRAARFSRLLALQEKIALEKNLPSVGKTVRVLCDGASKNNPALCSGRTEGNKIVFFEGDPKTEGQFLSIAVDRADPFSLWGKIVKSEKEE